MVTYNIAAPDRVQSYFLGGALANNPFSSVACDVFQLQLSCRSQNFSQGPGRAARRVAFQAMVDFDNFQIKAGAENLGGLACQPEEGVHPHGKIGGENDGNSGSQLANLRSAFIRVPCRTDDQRFSVLR